MSGNGTVSTGETGFDQVLGFTLPGRDARGRVVRLGPVLDEVLSAHDYPPLIRDTLAEALVLTALVGTLLKGDGSQLTLQAQAKDGVIDLLVCDYRDGELRGYVRHDPARLADLGRNRDLAALFGDGFLCITFDLATSGQRYQGVVPLEGASLAEAVQAYFAQSEQVPTLIRVGLACEGAHKSAGGLLVQHLPEGEEGRERLHVRLDHPEWQHVAVMAGSTKVEELVDPALSLEQLVWRLYHEEEEVRVHPGAALRRGCRCTMEHYQTVLSKFGAAELAEMRDEDGTIPVDCAFCSRQFAVAV